MKKMLSCAFWFIILYACNNQHPAMYKIQAMNDNANEVIFFNVANSDTVIALEYWSVTTKLWLLNRRDRVRIINNLLLDGIEDQNVAYLVSKFREQDMNKLSEFEMRNEIDSLKSGFQIHLINDSLLIFKMKYFFDKGFLSVFDDQSGRYVVSP
jgi:hypothetical protein